ncbi:MAG: MoaD/ThiS family protein [Chloroflexi bacterium]|nr:MoaD/ThiS family protein [Chloroflexota bacterium]
MSNPLELRDLAPEPAEEWRRMLGFVGWNQRERLAASRSIETLFRRGPELVAQTYDYLLHVPETAAILGWEQGVDEGHLEERRRFFTVWLARTLGLDSSDEFAYYLFRAGKYHAGHGPRHIHAPPAYVTGSIGLVLAAFAQFMVDAGLPPETIGTAMAAWNKYLAVQLNQMLLGYHAARALAQGSLAIRCMLFGRLRSLLQVQELKIHVSEGTPVCDLLRKFFDYYPQIRPEALERVWSSEEKQNTLWTKVVSAYMPRPGWRVLLNGRDLSYSGGFVVPLQVGDQIAIFPPGR